MAYKTCIPCNVTVNVTTDSDEHRLCHRCGAEMTWLVPMETDAFAPEQAEALPKVPHLEESVDCPSTLEVNVDDDTIADAIGSQRLGAIASAASTPRDSATRKLASGNVTVAKRTQDDEPADLEDSQMSIFTRPTPPMPSLSAPTEHATLPPRTEEGDGVTARSMGAGRAFAAIILSAVIGAVIAWFWPNSG